MKYEDAGVDIARADDVKEAIGRAVRGTWNDRVRPLSGGFAGLMDLPGSQGMQIAGGVPLRCGEHADFSTFRLGLFGLDKLGDIDGTVDRFVDALDRVLAEVG